MKRHLKTTAGLLAALMLVMSATACSPKTETVSSSGSGSSSQSTSSAEDETAPKNIKYKISWIGAQNNPLCSDPVMIKYWDEKFNVDIDYWNIDSANWNDVLGTKFAAGEYPDVMYVNSLSNLSSYISQDLLAEIPQSMLDKYMPNTIKKITADYPQLLKVGQMDGKQYSIPIGIYYANMFREPMCYRGDWMEKVGVTKAPTTLDEFKDLMYKFANSDPDGDGAKNTYGLSATGFAMVYGAFGVQRSQWNNNNGTLSYSSIQPAMKQALAVLAQWYKDGVIDPEFITGENSGGYWATSTAFVEGRIGYSGLGAFYHWYQGVGDYDATTKKYSKLQPGTNVAELAKVDADAATQIVQGQPVTGPDGKCGGVGYALPHPHSVGFRAGIEPDKMAKIMTMFEDWTSTKDEYFTARYGLKDQMWHYNTDGVPTSDFSEWKKSIGKESDDSVTLAAEGAHTVLESFIPLEYTSIENKYGFEWAKANGYDKNIIRDEKISAFPSSAKYETELTKMEDEAFISIITGKESVDYFDTFVKDWKSNGGDVLTKEANDWWATMK